MRYFPIFIDLQDRRALVVGGGEQATQKVRLLIKTTARIVVVAEQLTDELAGLVRTGRIEVFNREFLPSDLDGAVLAYVASGDLELDGRIAALARAWDIPVNVVDNPDQCSFITPAIVDRDPVVVAIGTEGTGPVFAQGLRARLETILPHRLGALAKKAGRLRSRVGNNLPAGTRRRAFWQKFYFGPIKDAFLAGDMTDFNDRVDRELDDEDPLEDMPGRVALVGAGPGDPDLLTLRARQLLQDADVIIHDRLVGGGVLDHGRRDAERIAVGKTPGRPSPSQAEINRTLIDHALMGKLVIRLKGGDPYIFGRGGEEQTALEAVGIPVEIVPGITAAAACAAALKLPLTTRGRNRAFTVLTGTTETGPAEHDWAALAQKGSAFAIYMGVGTAGSFQSHLLNAGMDPHTPVVIVENGTLPNERAFITEIASLGQTIEVENIKGPAIIFVGLTPTPQTRAKMSVAHPLQAEHTSAPFSPAPIKQFSEAS